MAAPVIDSVVPASASLNPGGFVDVVVSAHDPDSASGSVLFPVADQQGNVVQAFIDLVLEDPLVFGAAENPDGLAVVVQQIDVQANQATYRIQA